MKFRYVSIIESKFYGTGYISYRNLIRNAFKDGDNVKCKISEPVHIDEKFGLFGRLEEDESEGSEDLANLEGYHFVYYPNLSIYVSESYYQGYLFYNILRPKCRGKLIFLL
jgi:hypothetical protein